MLVKSSEVCDNVKLEASFETFLFSTLKEEELMSKEK